MTARRLLDTKYEPRVRCMSTYDLEVESAEEPRRRTIGTLEVTGSGPELRLYDQDPGLPWVAEATDPEGMKRRCATLPELGTVPTGYPEITPIRYKPRNRCVLRYALRTGSGARLFFGKILASGSDRLATTLSALQKASLGAPHMPRIAGPVAYWPDIRMLVQRAVEGSELHEVAFDLARDASERGQLMRTAGRGLAGLHSATGVAGPRRALSEDVDELDGYRAPMAQVDPALSRSFARGVEALRSDAGGEDPDVVCSHGAFRTDQFMIQRGELVMIDLDGFCWANPARDLGNLLAYLQWKAMRQPQHAAFIEVSTKGFLEGYAGVRPAPDERCVALYKAASLLKIAGRRFQNLTVREWPKVPPLIDAAHGILAG